MLLVVPGRGIFTPMRNASKARPREITPAKKRWFALVTMLIPVLVFAAAEIALRIARYGPDLSLFTTEEIAGTAYTIMNPDVKGRYFGRVEFSPNTSMDYFLRPKPAGTFRIFCLGGSTTVGFPYGYVGSFSTFLRDRLRKLFPERTIEVINLGMTATNSYTTVDIAREVVACEPDLVIVYDGHNEFYGALGVASTEGTGGSRWLARLHLVVVHFKTYQWIKSVIGRFSAHQAVAASGTMMERLARGKTIEYGSAAYRQALENFRENLQELKEIAAERSVPLILGSQVSNLRDFPPFISDPAQPPAAALTEAERLLPVRPDSAEALLAASAAESSRADYHYLLGRVAESSGRPAAARSEYVRARDLDQLRFRTTSDFNTAIREACASPGAGFADIEEAFMTASPDSLVGSNLILEHLHPNARGYFLMAKAYLAAMARGNLLAPSAEWARRDTTSDSIYWNDRPATELDERCAGRRIDILTSGWPFRRHIAAPAATGDALGQIAEKLVRGESTWEEAHVAAAQDFAARNDLDRAAREYRALISQLPLNISAYLLLGQLYLRQHRPDAATDIFRKSLACEPTLYALKALGSIFSANNAFDSAAVWMRRAYAMSVTANDRVEIGFYLGQALWNGGKTAEAEQQLAAVLQINPQFRPARSLLDKIRAAAPR